MTSARFFLVSLCLLVASVIWIAAAPATPAQTPGFGTDVQIAPGGKGQQSGFSIRVKVTELSTGKVVAAPQLIIPAGENGESKSDLPDGSATTVSVRVDAAGHTATYSVALTKGDQVLSSHTAKVILQ